MINSIIKLHAPMEQLTGWICQRHNSFTEFSIKPDSPMVAQIADEAWVCAKDFCKFLAKFKEAMVLMLGLEYPTLGMVLPVFMNIKIHVESSLAANADFELINTSKFIKAVKEKLKEFDKKIQ